MIGRMSLVVRALDVGSSLSSLHISSPLSYLEKFKPLHIDNHPDGVLSVLNSLILSHRYFQFESRL